MLMESAFSPFVVDPLQGINQIAIAEGMLLGTSLGLTPDLLASIINSSTGTARLN
jgi:3-hydroxyisobutyrate dehydrogenase-like beta-hydroxyacid dehydrogenase